MFDSNKNEPLKPISKKSTYQLDYIHDKVQAEIDSQVDWYKKKDFRASPLARTSKLWQKQGDKIEPVGLREQLEIEKNIPSIYQNNHTREKEQLAYAETWTNRDAGVRGQLKRGVRISGRRFTTGSYKRRLNKDQVSSECTQLYKNKTSNEHNIWRFDEIRGSENGTPSK